MTITTEGTLTATSVISTTDTDSNDITLTAIGDIEVGLIDAGLAGDVLINASGAITADDTDAVEVTADQLTATAGGTITLDTTIASADLTTTASGAIEVDETDSIELTRVTTADGSIGVTAGGPITATSVTSSTDSDTNDITLTTTVGDILVAAILAGSAGGVTLTSAAAISEDGDPATVITADELIATAGGSITLDTQVASANLTISGAGSIDLDESDAITLSNVTTQDGNIDVDAGAMTVLTITAGSESDVVLTSSGSITEDEMPSTDVTAYQLTAMAAGHVTLHTSVVLAGISTTATGDIRIHDSDAITLTDVTAGDGSVTITTEGTLTATSVYFHHGYRLQRHYSYCNWRHRSWLD